jgi:hypothetical protein
MLVPCHFFGSPFLSQSSTLVNNGFVAGLRELRWPDVGYELWNGAPRPSYIATWPSRTVHQNIDVGNYCLPPQPGVWAQARALG